jgi:hypothetical protein
MKKNYIPILCCSSEKDGKTESKFYYKGKSYKFVASPRMVSQNGVTFQKPDDKIPDENRTWRDLVVNGQKDPSLDLVEAYRLYKPDIFRDLYHEFDNRFYIFSAGWGIIRANFKIPFYDITYSTDSKVPKYAMRKDNFGWKDIIHLNDDYLNEDYGKFYRDAEVIVFAGSDYVEPFFCDMAQSKLYIPPKRIMIKYKSQNLIQRQDFVYEYYETDINTNWHYEAAKEFLNNYTKENQAKLIVNVSYDEVFSYFGFQYPPQERGELQRAYRRMVQKYRSVKVESMPDKKMKEINDMYDKALKYFYRR